MSKKILIVDDNVELLELLCLNFKGAGFAIATATNGVDALMKARSLSPDLILLDLILPELDGFAVCEILRNDPATASIPVIMLTGLTSQFSRIAGLEAGANECLTKPISPKYLISKVKDLVRQRKQPVNSETESRCNGVTEKGEKAAPAALPRH
jgi:two-component system alkaline phosphatase synthesis response regulator PhoP